MQHDSGFERGHHPSRPAARGYCATATTRERRSSRSSIPVSISALRACSCSNTSSPSSARKADSRPVRARSNASQQSRNCRVTSSRRMTEKPARRVRVSGDAVTSGRPQLCGAPRRGGGQALWCVNDVPGQAPTGLEDAAAFSQHGECVADSAEDVGVHDRVTGARSQRQGASVAAQYPCGPSTLRARQRLPGQVGADQTTPQLCSDVQTRPPSSGTEVQQPVAETDLEMATQITRLRHRRIAVQPDIVPEGVQLDPVRRQGPCLAVTLLTEREVVWGVACISVMGSPRVLPAASRSGACMRIGCTLYQMPREILVRAVPNPDRQRRRSGADRAHPHLRGAQGLAARPCHAQCQRVGHVRRQPARPTGLGPDEGVCRARLGHERVGGRVARSCDAVRVAVQPVRSGDIDRRRRAGVRDPPRRRPSTSPLSPVNARGDRRRRTTVPAFSSACCPGVA